MTTIITVRTKMILFSINTMCVTTVFFFLAFGFCGVHTTDDIAASIRPVLKRITEVEIIRQHVVPDCFYVVRRFRSLDFHWSNTIRFAK